MQLIRETGDGVYRIRAFEPGQLTINDTVYDEGVIVSLDRLITPWRPADPSSLSADDIAPALDLEPEIILLGTGERQQFPGRDLMRPLIERGIGIEVMDTASACRTFNVLMAESRRIVAALMV